MKNVPFIQASALMRVDLQALAQNNPIWQGQTAFSGFPRLLADIQNTLGEKAGQETAEKQFVNWTIQTELRPVLGSPDVLWLLLEVKSQLPAQCQRCLTPMMQAMNISRWFRFVDDEDIALEEDDESEEDLLVFSREFNLIELIEDELLMDLPIVPMHEECPNQADLPLSVQDEGFEKAQAERPNPFAALAQLKQGQSDNRTIGINRNKSK